MLRCGAWVGRDRVSERTREADPLYFLGGIRVLSWTFSLQKKPPLQGGLWEVIWFMSTVD